MTKKGEFTDEELANLSDEEREAIEEGEEQDEEQAKALRDIAGAGDEEKEEEEGEEKAGKGKDKGATEDEDDDGDADEEGEEKAEGAAKAKVEDKDKDKEGEEEEEGEEAVAEAGAEPFLPRYVAPPVEKYDEQITALDKQYTDATAKFKAGEIELDALLAQHREIEAKRTTLREQKLKADIAAEQATQFSEQHWKWQIGEFMREVKEAEGIDYKNNRLLNAALDQAVKDLANDEANKDRDGMWFLQEAHKQIKASFEVKAAADEGEDKGKGKPAEGRSKGKEADTKRKPNLKIMPKTLGNVPAAADDDAGGDPEFAHLEKLDGLEFEDAVARMSPAQQERYARSN